MHVAAVFKARCANGSLNDCAQGGDGLFAKAAAFMNVPAFLSMMVGVKETVTCMEGMRSDLHLRVQEFKLLELGCNLF